MSRRIAIITGSRADFGHLTGIVRAVHDDPDCTLQLIVTGSHLSSSYGLTVRDIEAEGFPIAARVDMQLTADTGAATAKSMGLAMGGFADAFVRLSPEIAVVLGDRFEILAAASAALVMRIPIAHVHGGEATEGVVDEAIRHAVTKMAYLHFAAADPYRDRIIQLGESPDRIFNFGAPGLDLLRQPTRMSRADLEKALATTLRQPLLLVTYHPVTLNTDDGEAAARALTEALAAFAHGSIVITGVNADPGNRRISKVFSDFSAANPKACLAVPSLGSQRYTGLMRIADAVVGNSSSGLIEAPALRVPSVNIGPRQKGRIRAPSVIDCGESADEIRQALTRALDPKFRHRCQTMPSPLDGIAVSPRIKDVLKSVPLSMPAKTFHNVAVR